MRTATPVQKDGPRINEEIHARLVHLIDKDGSNRGNVSVAEALAFAQAASLDLVEIAPNASPPVCKLLDYGKYKYQEQKKAAEARKKQKVVEVKEIKFRPMIDDHDYDVKMRSMQRFFEEGDKVKVTLRFRGRGWPTRSSVPSSWTGSATTLPDMPRLNRTPGSKGGR